jgi:hypothetical protein
MKRSRKRPVPLAVTPLEARLVLDGGLSASWLGQDGHDLVGPSSVIGPSGVQDIHILLSGLPAGKQVAFADVQPLGGGDWEFNGPSGPWAADLVRSSGASTADLYIEPYQQETGRPFNINLRYDDGTTDTVWLNGGVADPNLRMPQAAVQASWIGQDGSDLVGIGPSVGPDGLQDLHLALSNLSPSVAIASATLSGPAGLDWQSGVNLAGDSNAELIRNSADPTRADLYFQSNQDLAGQALTLDLAYANGKTDTTTIVAGASDPNLRAAPPAPPPTIVSGVTALWLGQDGLNLVGPGDVHLTVAGLPAGRAVVAASLSDQADALWVYRKDPNSSYYSDPFASPLGFRPAADPSHADLSFSPVRDETGATLTLRLQFDDGTTAIARVAGGAADVGEIGPGIATTSVVAHPGDDLNALANQYGTVHLSAGTYALSQPLVLHNPVAITADPGATLVFSQGASAPTWTAAIKVLAGHTTLDGFAVRFATPIRWTPGINYGPAVIGTTDNFDGVPNVPKTDLSFTNLDLQSPPASSPWEEAPRLIRLATAQSGRIAGNTLKGGVIEFLGGPWQIVNNTYQGTVPGTYAAAVFAGHATHDVLIQGNTAQQVGPSGKTWRFLVLTDGGVGDVVRGNTVTGIGPQDNDTVPAANAPEIILTEDYGLRFEGKPLALSADGLILQIPTPQGGAARTGDAVAILSGPAAGQWRRIAQAIDPNTYLLDSPLPQGDYAISIAGGFVNETFKGNTVDARGSSTAVDLFLAGDHFGTRVLDNHFLGGNEGFRILAAPTESPISWGWSHAPMLGLTVAGNTIDDAIHGGTLAVEHGPAVKTNQGRVYLSADVEDNLVRWSASFLAAHPSPPALDLGESGSLDPGELVVVMDNNRVEGPPGFQPGNVLLVPSATINGQALLDQQLPLPSFTLASPTGLALLHDTGTSSSDSVTNDGHLRFTPVAGAVGYEYRAGNSGAYQPITDPSAFLPAGLVQGVNTVAVRAFDALGLRSPDATITFTLDTTPPVASPPSLLPSSDTGRSSTDGITRITTPAFTATGDPGDTIVLLRNFIAVASRTGPGTLTSPAVPGDGTYYYSIRRTDLAGNTSSSPFVPVVIDTTPPPAVTGLAVGADGLVRFRVTSLGDTYEYRVGASGPYTTLGTTTSFNPSGLSPGANVVRVHAVDTAGNVGPDSQLVINLPVPTGAWLGQDGGDFVGPSSVPAPDGVRDIHIRLNGLPPARAITFADVEGLGGGEWLYHGPRGPWAAALVRIPGSTVADLYIQPYQRETGRPFNINLLYDDGTSASLWVVGGPADPTLRTSPAVAPSATVVPPASPAPPITPGPVLLTSPGAPLPAGTLMPTKPKPAGSQRPGHPAAHKAVAPPRRPAVHKAVAPRPRAPRPQPARRVPVVHPRGPRHH